MRIIFFFLKIEKQIACLIQPYVNIFANSAGEIEGDLKMLLSLVKGNSSCLKNKIKRINKKFEDILSLIEGDFQTHNKKIQEFQIHVKKFNDLFSNKNNNNEKERKNIRKKK